MRFSSRPVSRPVSSPGRTETYPPLLMRFLRTNANSRSRSRSRSKPIFFRRKTATSATETQEPSSPKVTCMGQVRINRSKKSKPGVTGSTPKPPKRQSKSVKNTFFCYPFTGKIKPNCFSPVWRKWKSFSHVSFSRKSEKKSSSSRSEPIFSRSTVEPEEHNLPREKEETNLCKSFTVTPPRNALLLTRCRSAPYRSSSLDYINGDFKEDDDNAAASPPSGNVSGCGETAERLEEMSRESEESEVEKRNSFGDLRERLVLTRCKSEPARLGERLVTDMCYRRNGRLGFT